MAAHAYLSASSSHRWLECTKSPFLESTVPDSTSFYAAEGTLAHEIGELMLKGNWKNQKRIVEDDLFYKGMVEEVEMYTSYCQERLNELLVEDDLSVMEIERRLDFSKFVPKGFGTGDCVLIGNKTLEVIDLKFGKGVPVDPTENSQLMLYGLGALDAFDFLYEIDTVVLTIAQVRLDGIKSWRISKNDLIKWGEEYVRPRAIDAYEGIGETVPGDWCRFCKFKSNCRARAEYNLELTMIYKEAKAESLTLEDIAKILDRESEISNWLKDITEYALDEALKGTYIPGYKVVEGRSNRKLIEPDKIAEVLMKNMFSEAEIFKPKEINNLTTLEKLVGKKDFTELVGDYIIKPPGKPTLVVESDKRPAINDIEDEFEFS